MIYLISLLFAMSAHAITLGQTEKYSDGLNGWFGPTPAVVLPSGGPAGDTDSYLRLTTATGGGILQVNSDHDNWGGNYLAAGVSAIEADMINLGFSPLQMRLLFSASSLTPRGSAWFTSTIPIVLEPDGQWHRVMFSLTEADLTLVELDGSATSDLGTSLRQVDRIIFRHQTGPPASINTSTLINGGFGIDNVIAIPEPLSISLCFGLVLTARGKSRLLTHAV